MNIVDSVQKYVEIPSGEFEAQPEYGVPDPDIKTVLGYGFNIVSIIIFIIGLIVLLNKKVSKKTKIIVSIVLALILVFAIILGGLEGLKTYLIVTAITFIIWLLAVLINKLSIKAKKILLIVLIAIAVIGFILLKIFFF